MLAAYVARRFLLTIPAMLAMSLIVFFIIRLVPGDPVLVILGLRSTPENVQALRQELRLDGVRGVAVTAVLAPGLDARASRAAGVGGPFPAGRCDRVAATVVDRLRHPGWEKVAGGAPAKAVVHGHALVPGVTEWLVARVAQRSRRRRGPKSDG